MTRRQGGNLGVGLSNGMETRIANKEAELERLTRRMARSMARDCVHEARRIAATGTITKAESTTPAGMLAARMMALDSRLDDMQAQVELLGASIYVRGRSSPKAGAAETAAAVALVAQAESYVSGIADALIMEADDRSGI